MKGRKEPQPGESKTFQSHHGTDSRWITASTDHERIAGETSLRVGWDDWDNWLKAHPGCVIATWYGINDQYYQFVSFQDGKIQRFRVTPPNQGCPWWPQEPATPIETMPDWVVQALIDLGEVTTPEIEEERAVASLVTMHECHFRGMALDICLTPILEKFGGRQ